MTRIFTDRQGNFPCNPDGLLGKSTPYAGKKTVQAVCNAYEKGFLKTKANDKSYYQRFNTINFTKPS